MRVAVIEPSDVVRTRVVVYLRESGIDVVATATSIAEAEQRIAGLRPDVVVSEIMVGTHRGLELVDALRVLAPGSRLVIFTNETHFRGPCVARGVDGFIDKSSDLDQLLRALKR